MTQLVSMLLLSSANAIKLLVSAVLGGMIGIEREYRRKPAGLRTHILVSLAATLFTLISVDNEFLNFGAANFDPSRIASNVLTGVGFLGAGVIISMGGQVKGITTAASLWIATAIGMAVGLGEYGLAVFVTLLTFVVLALLFSLEKYIRR